MSERVQRIAEIRNSKGLHARAAAKFCKLTQQFESDVTVSRNGTEVSGGSIMGLMMLAAATGTTIEISAVGADAAKAIDALCELVAAKFGEE
jgi:phosphocarrier protein HPr